MGFKHFSEWWHLLNLKKSDTIPMKHLILAALFLLPSISQAVLCMPAKRDPNKIGDYLMAVVATFEYLKEARDSADVENAKKESDFIVAIKNTDSRLECAAQQISSFKESKVETIAQAAKSLESSISVFRMHNDVTLQKVKNAIDGKKEEGAPSERAEKEADLAMAVKSAWESVALSIALSTHAAVDPKRQAHLVLSKAERSEILSEIKKSFRTRKKTDNHTIEISIDMLSKFLNGKWKASDEK